MEFLNALKIILYAALAIAGLVLFLASFGYIAEWLGEFLYKILTILTKPFKKLLKPLPPSPLKRCAELESKIAYLQKELDKSKRARKNADYRNYKNNEFLKAEHEREIGQVVKSEFNDIILNFIDSKPLAPNVSIEHLASLCSVPKANDKFFRALLQEFKIERLEVNNVDGKHTIKMKLRSGENTYEPTLTTCTCDDFKKRKQKVCKHMYFLALTLGLISREHFEQFHECAKSFPEKKLKSLMKKK